MLFPSLSTTEESTGRNSSLSRSAVIGTDQRRTRHDGLCRQALGEVPVKFAIGVAVREWVGGTVERDDMHESDPIVEQQDLVLDSAGISASQFYQHVLNQLAIALRALAGR
jgi:hypothetical protein